ncbi:TetR/AcrR family transcriptional regulator [Paenibacillus sp. P46E]|uniref:TetR/AcrR family transcriptional regulator n=1 Tax=Paenibacillus sp. P46E TaxID=1349436 RepID=UPI00093B02E1|nr:TetR/AcrR family transcriptional regulator [Paenibacillus sp. P46E]OKP97237.1 transcriptional regulator [Paenibacillus sp. P46E]
MDQTQNDLLSPPEHSKEEEGQPKGARRRGDVLENAILQAAWEELEEVGYAQLTMENIAVRAKTNKTAIYRRWPNKVKIVVAAIVKHVPQPDIFAPATGDLRKDVINLLQGISKPMQKIGAETIHALMVEYHGNDLSSQLMRPKTEDKLNAAMKNILKNAQKRGEVRLEQINERVVSLPIDLLRYEILTTHEPVSDSTILEIVDDIFLPLVRQ